MRFLITGIILIAGIFSITGYAFAQTRVTAHATAEIVEGWHAVPETRNHFYLQPNKTGHIEMGEISLSSSRFTVCDVTIRSATLTGEHGCTARFDAMHQPQEHTRASTDGGHHIFNLYGKADEDMFSKPDRNYTGQYQIIFSYN